MHRYVLHLFSILFQWWTLPFPWPIYCHCNIAAVSFLFLWDESTHHFILFFFLSCLALSCLFLLLLLHLLSSSPVYTNHYSNIPPVTRHIGGANAYILLLSRVSTPRHLQYCHHFLSITSAAYTKYISILGSSVSVKDTDCKILHPFYWAHESVKCIHPPSLEIHPSSFAILPPLSILYLAYTNIHKYTW